MTNIVASQVGSGTIPFVRAILPSGQRGSDNTGLAAGVRTGIQVMVGNPEDLTSVDAFAVSGIAVSTTPLKIFGANQNPLPRARKILIENGSDSTTLLVANSPAKVISEGWQLVNGTGVPRAFIELPIMGGVDVWAAAATGTVQVRILIF